MWSVRVWREGLHIRSEFHQSRPLAKSRIRETDNVALSRKKKHSFGNSQSLNYQAGRFSKG